MRRSLLLTAAAVLLASAAGCAGGMSSAPGPDPSRFAAALNHPTRPLADRERDAARRPAEVLAFAGVREGWRVGEYMPGAGYFTRVLALAVGPDGSVFAYQPSEIVRLRPAYLTEIQAVAAEPGLSNVTVTSAPTREFSAPHPLDLVITVQNYHDLYGPFAAQGTGAAFDRAAFAALKPGGVYLVVDHHAAQGSGLSGAGQLHRIERQAAVDAITAAGFVLEAESDLLLNPGDPLTASVFDPSIRGNTSQFMLRFRKPR